MEADDVDPVDLSHDSDWSGHISVSDAHVDPNVAEFPMRVGLEIRWTYSGSFCKEYFVCQRMNSLR